MIFTVTDHTDVSEHCHIYRAVPSYRGVERYACWFAECETCGHEESFFGGTAKDDATKWGTDHECPVAVQVDES